MRACGDRLAGGLGNGKRGVARRGRRPQQGTPLMPLTPSRLMWSLSASSEPFIQASVDTFKGIYGDYVSLMSGVKSSPTPLIPANSPQPH